MFWDSAVDDAGVTNYDIYVNGQKSYTIGNQSSFVVYSLTDRKSYSFAIKARDFSGNQSPFSNQVVAIAAFNGLNYSYYEGTYNTLPDFNSLIPLSTGVISNVSLTPRQSETNFAFKWEGYINIPVAGNYTFQTASDDGSKLYIDTVYSSTAGATVNNDGLHGTVTKTSQVLALSAGPHRFTATFMQQGGGYAMTVKWKTPKTGTSFITIPDSAFVEKVTSPGTAPKAPSALVANALSYKRVALNWTSNSSDEIAFEIYRSTSSTGPFVTIGRTLAHVTSFADSVVQASTTYYYKVKAINVFGSSLFNGEDSSGLKYKYYETGSLSALPNFSTLTPTSTGTTAVFDLNIPNRGANFAVSYDGFITIPTTGNYTFYTSSDDGSKLYLNGTAEANRIVNNDGLHGTQQVSGVVNNLSAGAHIIRGTYFQQGGGQAFSVSISGPGLAKQTIPASMLGKPVASATTLAAPGTPGIPVNFTVQAQSPSKIKVSWADAGSSATSFELYRSSNTNTSYALLKTIPASGGTINYVDSSLFSNALYFYKVRALNQGGNSGFTAEASATTLDNIPVATPISNKNVRYTTQLQVSFVATDADNEQLTTVVSNLPSFGSFLSTGNGTATITFSPAVADAGVYNNITVTATDQHGGVASSSFNLTVNDNYNPEITGTSTTVSVNEGSNTSLVLNANDQNASDNIAWVFSGLPSFITPTITGTGSTSSVTFAIHPGYADNGIYNFTASTSDGRGGSDDKAITVTVSDVNPSSKVYLNFKDATGVNAAGVWNNLNATPAINNVLGSFTDDSGAPSTVGLKILTNWQNVPTPTGNTGVNTGNNSGVYPDAVISTYWWSNTKQTFKITGLDTSSLVRYRLTFFGSSGKISDTRTSQYTVNGNVVTLVATNNSTNTVNITGLVPASDSSLSVDMAPIVGTGYSYLNALVIERIYDDHTIPATPRNLAASLTTNLFAGLTWTATAYNDNGYQVYRSTSVDSSNYILIATTAPKANSYVDSLVSGSSSYNYKVRAINAYGNSEFSGVAQLAVPNRPPLLAAISNQTLKGDASVSLPLSVSFDAGNTVVLLPTSLPTFVTLTDNGNGTGTLLIAPTNSQLGTFPATITARDNHNLTSVQNFTITVSDKNITSVFVNFNQLDPVGLPWNSFNSLPNANAALNGLKDESGATTSVNITLLDKWTGANEVGAVTGNNSGVYPDNVMMTAFYEQTTDVKRIKLSGLSSSLQYNLVFFGSRIATDTRITRYTAGGQTVQLNAANNTSTTVQINALSPDVNGEILITVAKDAAAPYAYINALVIQSFTPSGTPLSPANLTAAGLSKNQIQLTWSDRSANETGFEIWRAPVVPGSTALSGPMALITTVPANTTTYMNSGLPSSANYVYKVRAIAGAATSDYSNPAYAATSVFLVYVNFNRDNPAVAPWNNTNGVPNQDAVYPNLKDDQNNTTGINLTVVDNFSGDNQFGTVTGNNSGIYPDNVIIGSWWVDAGVTAKIKIDGLNQSMMYNFVFFGSRYGSSPTDASDRTTIYSIGSNTVSLNATNNTSKTVQINGMLPDSSGAVYITITKGAIAPFGYLNALVIQAANSFNAPVVILSSRPATSRMTAESDSLDALNSVVAFPNPFSDDVRLHFGLQVPVSKLNVSVRDLTGRIIFVKQLNNLPQGSSVQELGVNANSIRSGIYLVEISGLPGGRIKVLKLIKR
ncbi:MAG TPA: PA14 domain-containing protein [Puia sp.]|nr:PA14 domain-containing protein [Puia sp.]